MNNKSKGTAWEYKFFSSILDQELDLFIPAGDNLPMDCVVGNSAGKLFKVQVKGTTRDCKSHKLQYPRYKIVAGTGTGSKTPIDCTKVDVLAVYIAPMDLWYIVPCLALDGKVGLWFYPGKTDSTGKHEKFRNNWDFFKTA